MVLTKFIGFKPLVFKLYINVWWTAFHISLKPRWVTQSVDCVFKTLRLWSLRLVCPTCVLLSGKSVPSSVLKRLCTDITDISIVSTNALFLITKSVKEENNYLVNTQRCLPYGCQDPKETHTDLTEKKRKMSVLSMGRWTSYYWWRKSTYLRTKTQATKTIS